MTGRLNDRVLATNCGLSALSRRNRLTTPHGLSDQPQVTNLARCTLASGFRRKALQTSRGLHAPTIIRADGRFSVRISGSFRAYRHVSRQRELGAELERDGHDATRSRALLQLFENCRRYGA